MLPHYNKNPTFQAQFLDNVSVALKMLEQVGLKLPFLKAQSISCVCLFTFADIVDGDSKMLLGLMWQLVLHKQMRELPQEKQSNQLFFTEDESLKQSLLKWTQSKVQNYPGVQVKDFNNSFKDGSAFLALVHSFKPNQFDFALVNTVFIV